MSDVLKKKTGLGLSVQCVPDLWMPEQPDIFEKAWKLRTVNFVILLVMKNHKNWSTKFNKIIYNGHVHS